MEIFTLVTGVAYIILEIRQKNFMWVVGVATSLAAIYTFMTEHLYASVILNVYYFGMSFWGLYQWSRDSKKMTEISSSPQPGGTQTSPSGEDAIHLNRLTWKTVLGCTAFFVAGLFLMRFLLNWLGDPMSGLDAAVAVLSAVATYMLSRSYLEQWILWVVADVLSTVLCATQGLYWMTALYALYTASAVYGYIYWKRKGVYIS